MCKGTVTIEDFGQFAGDNVRALTGPRGSSCRILFSDRVVITSRCVWEHDSSLG